MTSMGVFHKVEMDEKPFLSRLIEDGYERDYDDIDVEYGDITHNFLEHRVQDEKVVNKELLRFNSPPHFASTRNIHLRSLHWDKDNRYFCKLPVLPLFWCNNKEPENYEFKCGLCLSATVNVSYYACPQCQKKFHKECVESPLEIKHPSHPFHTLQLRTPIAPPDRWYKLCTSCGKDLANMSYECTTCDLSMHPVCALKPVPFVLDHPKSHPHPLTFYPAQASLVCQFCAQVKKHDPTYICIQCVFAIHKDCLGFPHVIRICRHQHRLSFTSSLPHGEFPCGVCWQQVDNNYGAYTCSKGDAYFVHSKCALHPKVWDGIDLDGVPEEDDMIDDGEPFKRIADGIILHPFHSHNLRLETSIAYDGNKFCRGCAFQVYEGQIYSCMECDYILHESCAYAPRMKRHPLDPHPLKLVTMGSGSTSALIQCRACDRDISGFYYEHYARTGNCLLDLSCASITEPFRYKGHEHPLFIPLEPKEGARCQMCRSEESKDLKLICMECDYIICFRCATFPCKARYKHDDHFLTLCDGKEASDEPDWCEICEGKIEEVKEIGNRKTNKKERRFYKCDECCTTLHAECLLGVDILMVPGNTIKDCIGRFYSYYKDEDASRLWRNKDVRILLNSSLSRPLCGNGFGIAMDSGGDDLPLQPLFLCPAARIKFLKSKLEDYDHDNHYQLHPFDSSPHFPNTRSSGDYQQGESLLDCDDGDGIFQQDLCLHPCFHFSCMHKEHNDEIYLDEQVYCRPLNLSPAPSDFTPQLSKLILQQLFAICKETRIIIQKVLQRRRVWNERA
ncbi:unnamed protein product [Thlaspi arvense]|uniref:B box-type domain-containing protein n=1 Tax=Thlaspi arvense TaxID=13288 RepID=A0AAU9ST53_THLAR|nr:unnamed protein product [Thlaspi arvense]